MITQKNSVVWGILVGFLLISGCSAREYENSVKKAQEIQEEGYSLTLDVFVPPGTYLGKGGGEYGQQTQKMFLKNNKVRVDQIYPAYEVRKYLIPENGQLTITVCDNKLKSWNCTLVSSQPIPKVDEKALKELDLTLLKGLKPIPDQQILGIQAKCFEIVKDSTICYHPRYMIQLAETRPNGFTLKATNLVLESPPDKIFTLPT